MIAPGIHPHHLPLYGASGCCGILCSSPAHGAARDRSFLLGFLGRWGGRHILGWGKELFMVTDQHSHHLLDLGCAWRN